VLLLVLTVILLLWCTNLFSLCINGVTDNTRRCGEMIFMRAEAGF
jgi:hypothetical protein